MTLATQPQPHLNPALGFNKGIEFDCSNPNGGQLPYAEFFVAVIHPISEPFLEAQA